MTVAIIAASYADARAAAQSLRLGHDWTYVTDEHPAEGMRFRQVVLVDGWSKTVPAEVIGDVRSRTEPHGLTINFDPEHPGNFAPRIDAPFMERSHADGEYQPRHMAREPWIKRMGVPLFIAVASVLGSVGVVVAYAPGVLPW